MGSNMIGYSLESVDNLVLKNIDIPECMEGWALIRVKAAGICSSDIPRIFKKGTYHFPTIPGHEFSGVVEKVGSKIDEVLLGKRVGVFPLIPCFKCAQCKEHHYEMCSNYDYIGSRRDGGFAEYVLVPVWNLIPLLDEISFEEAAMLEPLSVALHAMKCGNIKKGSSIGIIGTGMIGFAAAQWAKKMGAKKVTVIGRANNKKEIANSISVEYLTMEQVEGEQFDVVLEAVGFAESIQQAIMCTKPAGTLILMGNPDKDIMLQQDVYWRILRKQLHLVGTWNSAYEHNEQCDWTETVDALAKHEIEAKALISHRFMSERLPEALDLMRSKKEPYCKVMTIWKD